jgi:hypothetical protein
MAQLLRQQSPFMHQAPIFDYGLSGLGAEKLRCDADLAPSVVIRNLAFMMVVADAMEEDESGTARQQSKTAHHGC